MKRVNCTSSQGSIQAIVLVIAVALAVLMLGLAQFEKTYAGQNNYIVQMDRALQLAEMGMSASLGVIARTPEKALEDAALGNGGLNNSVQTVGNEGTYTLQISQRNIPFPGIYYVICTGERIVSGKSYKMRLHSYIQISNASDYFAAVNDNLYISHGVDLSSARVYGLSLFFQRSANHTYNLSPAGSLLVTGDGLVSQTVVKNADFYNNVGPNVDVANCSGGNCDWLPTGGDTKLAIQSEITVTNGGIDQAPSKLGAPLLLPQVLSSDMVYYEGLATGAHTDPDLTPNAANTFTNNIYPPGYVGAKAALDTYGGHDAINQHHVYFFNGPVNVQGTVHGQVIIVSKDHIHITGDIISAPALDPIPGAGSTAAEASSSTAHQLVLIPGPNKNVYIEDSVWAGGPAPREVRIEALIMTPNGSIVSNVKTHQTEMKLHFVGSLILGKAPDLADSFQNTSVVPFPVPRKYEYMTTLQTNPPPYLPGLIEIYHSLSEVVSSPNLN